jgi:hypothetical protein
MVGNHIVTRSSFGFDNKLKRVTGFVRCDSLTSRFADKSAIIEDEEYSKFYRSMQNFITNTVIPSLSEYEDVLITREESKIYKEIDKVLGQAVVENIETEEVEGYETVEVKEIPTSGKVRSEDSLTKSQEHQGTAVTSLSDSFAAHDSAGGQFLQDSLEEDRPVYAEAGSARTPSHNISDRDETSLTYGSAQGTAQISQPPGNIEQQALTATIRKIRRPILKKTFALKKVGYKVIPYEDESDSRYSFSNENVVFVNKANSTYTAEATRGDEFLLRHIIGIVAEAIAGSKHPEGKSALELQNRLVAEAIRIHDNTSNKNRA